jgi:hypothetical protein
MVELEISTDPWHHCKDVTLNPSLWDENSHDKYDVQKFNKTNTTTVDTPTHRLLYPMRFSTFARHDP